MHSHLRDPIGALGEGHGEETEMRNPTGMTLADLKPGENGIIKGISGDISLKRRLAALGLVNGTSVALGNVAPLGDPRIYELLDYA